MWSFVEHTHRKYKENYLQNYKITETKKESFFSVYTEERLKDCFDCWFL